MPRDLPPVLGVVLVFLRQRAGWGQQKLARKLGIGGPSLSRYETGKVPLTRARFDELVAPLGYSKADVDRAVELGEQLRPGAAAPRDAEQAAAWMLEDAVAHIGREARGAAHSEIGRFLAEKQAEKERRQAGEDWALLSSRPSKDWPILIAGASAYQGWAFCERVCAESERAAADRADRALDLARLAVRIAETTPVDNKAKRARLRGYAEVHLSSAWRVAGDLPTADRTYTVAQILWKEGRTSGLPLDESRVLDLGASLRRAQRRFSEALEMLDSALKLTTSNEGFCRIMLKKALTLEQSGDYEMAATVHVSETPQLSEKNRLASQGVVNQ
jgi:transcriptional regulator with XRE-family HTH domain